MFNSTGFELFEMTPVDPLVPLQEIYSNYTIDSDEDWDDNKILDTLPISPFVFWANPRNPLRDFSAPQNDQVQCLGSHTFVNNNPTNIVRHSRQCPVSRHNYM